MHKYLQQGCKAKFLALQIKAVYSTKHYFVPLSHTYISREETDEVIIDCFTQLIYTYFMWWVELSMLTWQNELPSLTFHT